jgi:hypothetical protein
LMTAAQPETPKGPCAVSRASPLVPA